METAEQNTIFEIAPPLKRALTAQDLIASEATFSYIRQEMPDNLTGTWFRFKHADYEIHYYETELDLVFARNSNRVRFRKPANGAAHVFVGWTPTEISLVVIDREYKASVDGGADPLEEIGRIKQLQVTPIEVPPYDALTYVRKMRLVPVETYETENDFRNEVLSALGTVTDTIQSTGMIRNFWEDSPTGLKPVRETDAHKIVWALLFNIAIAKGMELSPEQVIAGGRLDFLFTAQVKGIGTSKVCVEFKNGHSADIVHGYTDQLPDYMQANGSDFGIYVVLWYKGDAFDEPKFEQPDLQAKLLEAQIKAQRRDNTFVKFYDLSDVKSPSKR